MEDRARDEWAANTQLNQIREWTRWNESSPTLAFPLRIFGKPDGGSPTAMTTGSLPRNLDSRSQVPDLRRSEPRTDPTQEQQHVTRTAGSADASIAIGVDDYPDHNPVEVWHQLVGEYVRPMEVSPAPDEPFRARMRTERMGPIEVLEVAATPYVVHRSPKTIALGGDDPGQIFCSLQLSGPHLIVQGRQEILRRPGELVIFDPQHPCTLVCPESVNFLAFVFPRRAVGFDLEVLTRGAATVLPTDQGVGALVTSFLRQLGGKLGDVRPATATRLAGHTLDLLSTFFADLRGTEPSIDGAAQRSLVVQVQSYIEANLTDPDMSSTAIAAAHHVSIRHLQKLFETQGLTVSGWIRERRLEHARRDLANPAQRGVPITVIASRWRFADSAHFSRVFKAAHGLSPRDYRHGQSIVSVG